MFDFVPDCHVRPLLFWNITEMRNIPAIGKFERVTKTWQFVDRTVK
jgi:hypothetical protein